MLILRIKRAETALADGRLDEAFELAGARDVQAHRRGQDLMGRLARAMVERGRLHLEAGRLQQAAADGDKASVLAGNLPEASELRAAVKAAIVHRERRDRQQADAVHAARRHIQDGQLSLGENVLAAVADDTRAPALQNDAAARRGRAEDLLERARVARERNDLPGTAELLAEARRLHPSNGQVVDMIGTVTAELVGQLDAAIEQGRLDLAEIVLESVEGLAPGRLESVSARRFLKECRQAAVFIAGGRARQAVTGLKCLLVTRPAAAWLGNAVQEAIRAAESLEGLRAGPLGLLGSGDGDDTQALSGKAGRWESERVREGKREGKPHEDTGDPQPLHRRAASPALLPEAQRAAPQLPDRLLLHMDGGSSYLLLSRRRITIGPAGSSRTPDLPLMLAAGVPMVTIERMDEDYFLAAEQPVRVNGTPVTRKLLAGGDRIELSPRCGMKFELPNPASTSAVLSLFGTRLPNADARHVVLLDRSLVLGAMRTAHVRSDLPEQAVLHVRDGRLFCRAGGEVTVNERPMDRQGGIPLDARVAIGQVGFVVKSA